MTVPFKRPPARDIVGLSRASNCRKDCGGFDSSRDNFGQRVLVILADHNTEYREHDKRKLILRK